MADEIVQQQPGSASKKNRKILFWVGYITISSIIAFFGTFFLIVLTEKPQPDSGPLAGQGADSSLVAQMDSSATDGGDSLQAALASTRVDSLDPAKALTAGESETPVDGNAGPKFALNTAEAAEKAASEPPPEAPPDYKQLAKIYSNMDSKAAAKILSKLGDPMVVGILSEMRDRDAADVLTAVTPDRAAVLSEKLSKLQSVN